MELGQKGKGLTFKLYHDVPERYKATAADTARFEKFLKIMIKKTTKAIGKNLTRYKFRLLNSIAYLFSKHKQFK